MISSIPDEDDRSAPHRLNHHSMPDGAFAERIGRAVRDGAREPITDGEQALKALAAEQRKQAVHEGRSEAIASAMAEAGLISVPIVEGAYRVGTRRVVDEQPVALWFAAQTAPSMEVKAKTAIEALGYHCYVPMRAYWRFGKRVMNGKQVKRRVEVPLCTGYAFLGLPSMTPDWRTIRSRDGVVDIVGYAGTPQPIRRTLKLHAIMAAEAAGEFDEAKEKPEVTFSPGDSVRVVDGPFAGFVGRVKRAKGDCVKIIIDALFGGADVDVSIDSLAQN